MSSFHRARRSSSPESRNASTSDESTLRLPPILSQDARQQHHTTTSLPPISALDVTESAHGSHARPLAASLIEHTHPLSLRSASGQLAPQTPRSLNQQLEIRQEHRLPRQTTHTLPGLPQSDSAPASTRDTAGTSFTRPPLPHHIITEPPRPIASAPALATRESRPSDSPERARQLSEASSAAREYASLSISSTSRSSLSYSATSASSTIPSSFPETSPA